MCVPFSLQDTLLLDPLPLLKRIAADFEDGLISKARAEARRASSIDLEP